MAKKQFKAESKRLLDLMINSIYTNKEIFLREIISNASDAIDKLWYQSLTDDSVGLNRDDYRIRIYIDKDARTITVRDNGIGMTKEEAEANLGVIAKSGSYKFKGEMDEQQGEDISIIGQFGVGFYSAFMVSDKVTVLTRKFGEEKGVQWESTGADGYTVTFDNQGADSGRGGIGSMTVKYHVKPRDLESNEIPFKTGNDFTGYYEGQADTYNYYNQYSGKDGAGACRSKARHRSCTWRYLHHLCRCTGRLLPSGEGGPRRGWITNLCQVFSLSGGNEPQAGHFHCGSLFLPDKE